MRVNLSIFAFFVATLASCVTVPDGFVTLKEQNISIGELKTIIHQVIPLGIRSISPNGREFFSQNYLYQDGQYIPAKDSSIRYFARVLILNSSRPYDIQIEVRQEIREDSEGRIRFVDKGPDIRLAKILKAQLHDRLAKRRDDLNVIDDFRVF